MLPWTSDVTYFFRHSRSSNRKFDSSTPTFGKRESSKGYSGILTELPTSSWKEEIEYKLINKWTEMWCFRVKCRWNSYTNECKHLKEVNLWINMFHKQKLPLSLLSTVWMWYSNWAEDVHCSETNFKYRIAAVWFLSSADERHYRRHFW